MWAEDECRLGLVPIVRRVWAPKGQRPAAVPHLGRQWLYVYGFVRPGTAQTFWLLLPEVTAEWTSAALGE
ncbi:MAG TPA: IS630 family transposase, partial [Pirellulales bacterium]